MNNENVHQKESILKNPHFQNGMAFALVEIFLLLSFFAGLNTGFKTAENIYKCDLTDNSISTEHQGD